MLLKHYFTPKIAHSSYLLAGENTCAVIDPRRDVDIYIEEARRMGVDITHIIETHLHADFISGHMDLAKRTGGRIYVPKSAECEFEHIPVSEGETIEIEDMELKVLETPGHTPEAVSYVVIDKSRGDGPSGVFTGDALFVGDVGRPDLFPDMAEELAGKLYRSLHEKLMKLPDYCEVYPAHGAGSLCGRAMGAKWRSTIGYERRFNEALNIEDRNEFIESLTRNMPPAPDHFSRCSDINRKGPALTTELPVLSELKPGQFMDKISADGIVVLDVRSYDGFGSQHIAGSWHIDFGGNFPTFAGWVMSPGSDIILVASDFEEAEEANVQARRVGVDSIVGYLKGGMFGWAVAGYQTGSVNQISAERLHEMMVSDAMEGLVLLDVRSPREFRDNHIEGAVNIPAPDLRTRFGELDPERNYALICSTGHRSSLGTSILKQHGFSNLYNVAGGMTGYSAAGYSRACRVCENPHGSRYADGYLDAGSDRDNN